ncbi:hypothetical protein F5Y08DRAFT_349621 [Xylaria arbuscula]|nr:hypothetical protein F5Y08DRAFT_349621 [Xylaria arbuscula]
MADQCIISEKYLPWELLVTDLDGYRVQDAMAIILFPTQQRTGVFSNALRDHYRLWETCNLPNPLKGQGKTFSGQGQTMLLNLFNRLLIFIEDYLTKATGKHAGVEYLCLPDLSTHSRRQSALGYSLSTRFNAANLSSRERKRLLRAFLRYELMCKFCCSDNFKIYRSDPDIGRRHYSSDGSDDSLSNDPWYYELRSLWKYGGHAFQPSDAEAIKCVQIYVESLYDAVLCNTTKLWPTYEEELHAGLACFGFDLATAILQATTSGQQGRNHIKMWYDSVNKPAKRFTPGNFICRPRDRILGYDPREEKDEHYLEGPGMYQALYSWGDSSNLTQRRLYREVAWPFFDDLRFHPESVQRYCFTSRRWIQELSVSTCVMMIPVKEPQDWRMQLAYPTPPRLKNGRFINVAPFWHRD